MAEGGRDANCEARQVGDGGISNTVEVSGFSTNTSQELIEMYFENSRRSGGGDMEDIQIRDGVAYITFKEAEVAQRVVSHNHHQVDGQTLTVTLFLPLPPKPCYENRVLLQGLNSAVTEELLRNFMETATEAKVREFLYGEEEGNVVVTLSDNIDIVELRKTFQERSIEGACLKVARVAICNCIFVQKLQPSTSHDAILFYFENKRRSGGGDVERVEMKADEGYCQVYFEDHSVIDRVLSQSHKVDGGDVEVHIHHECLGQRSSRNKSDPYLRISSPGNKDGATLEEENTDNQAKYKASSSISSNPDKESDFVEVQEWQENDDSATLEEENTDDQAKDKASSSVSSNPDKESDFVEVQEWQENDGKNCMLTLWIKYKRAPEMMIVKDMKKIPCSWNFNVYWNFYTKTKQGQEMLHEIVNKCNCSVAVCTDDEDLFIFEVTEKSFEQELDVVHYMHVVLDNVYKCAQQFLYFGNLLVDQRMQGDVLQVVRQRKELDIARIELMGQQDLDAMCVICAEKDKMSVLHVVTEIIYNLKECFKNHEEIISVDHKWQKVMKYFGYLQKLGDKYPSVTIIPDETKSEILLKGQKDQSKAAADHLLELLGAACSEVQEDIFSPGCQFEIFTYQEMCDYIDNIIMELSVVWIPNHLTKKIHLFSKKLEKIKGIDKLFKGCVQERLYPLQRDQSVCFPEMFRSLEELKKKHTGKIVVNSSPKGLLVTTADDIFDSVEDAVQKLIDKETEEEDSRVNIAIVTGSLLGQKVDIIVNSTTTKLDLETGSLSKAILAVAGSSIQDECRQKYPNGIKFGEVAVTSAGQLNLKRIFHGALRRVDQTNLHLQSLRSLMKNCLQKVKEEKCNSIAFPALGIGQLQYPVEDVAKVMFRTVTNHADQYGVKQIKFVIAEGDTNVYNAFKEMENTRNSLLHSSTDCKPEYEVSLKGSGLKIAIVVAKKYTNNCDVDVVLGSPTVSTPTERYILTYDGSWEKTIIVERNPKYWSETLYLCLKSVSSLKEELPYAVEYVKYMKFTSLSVHISQITNVDVARSAIEHVIVALDTYKTDVGDLECVMIVINDDMLLSLTPWFDENVKASHTSKTIWSKISTYLGIKVPVTWKKFQETSRTYLRIVGDVSFASMKTSYDTIQKRLKQLKTMEGKEARSSDSQSSKTST